MSDLYWLTADVLHRNDRDNVKLLETPTRSIRRRMQLHDAARFGLDQALTAQGQAAAQASSSLADREQARAGLTAGFPGLTLPDTEPEIATPDRSAAALEAWLNRVIADSHEIRAADREAECLVSAARRQINDAHHAEILARPDAVRAPVKLRIDAHDLWLEREQP